jgi:flagellar basal-body rod modification protein FlgD
MDSPLLNKEVLMTVSPVNSINTTQTPSRIPTKELSQSDFLKVMVAQLGQQNPLKPSDSNEFMNQFMSMGNFQATQEMSINIKNLQGQNTTSYAAALIGKKVQVLDAAQQPVTGIIDSTHVIDKTIFFEIGGVTYEASKIQAFLQ